VLRLTKRALSGTEAGRVFRPGAGKAEHLPRIGGETGTDMIRVTSINRVDQFWVNEEQIEFMKETPDTILSMVSGRKVPVAETAEEIVKIIAEARAADKKNQSAFRLEDPD